MKFFLYTSGSKKDFKKLASWLWPNRFYRAQLKNSSEDEDLKIEEHVQVHPADANLVSSIKANGKHCLFLDLDMAHQHIPSTTPGHAHLFINADLSRDALQEIVDVLAKHKILQAGVKRGFDERGFLSLRIPGSVKGDPVDDMDLEHYKKYTAIKDADEKYQYLVELEDTERIEAEKKLEEQMKLMLQAKISLNLVEELKLMEE